MEVVKGWRTIRQNHTQSYTASGHFEPTVEVYFETDNGTPGMKAFPEARYNWDNVVSTINEFVERENQIAQAGNGK